MPKKAPLKPRETGAETPRRVSGWVKAFVAFHVVAICAWSIPAPPKAIMSGVAKPRGAEHVELFNETYVKPSPIQYYLLSTGFWQYWDMFAPNPASTDIWCDAEVYFRDGSHHRYQYPRIYLLSLPLKYVKERYRKFYERVNQTDNAYMWPFFAQRIALINTSSLDNPVVKVDLYRHWLDVAPPGKPPRTTYNEYKYTTVPIDQELLRRQFLEGR